MRTRSNMAVGAPGEWKHKPQPIPNIEVRAPRVVDPRFVANPSKKPASTGAKPKAPELSAEELRKRQAQDGKANPGDVHGHNERQRAELPNKPLTPNTTFKSQAKAPRKKPGFVALGSIRPDVEAKHVRRAPKKPKAPRARKGYVYDLPEHLKKYASK
jgi:hypothetical protein